MGQLPSSRARAPTSLLLSREGVRPVIARRGALRTGLEATQRDSRGEQSLLSAIVEVRDLDPSALVVTCGDYPRPRSPYLGELDRDLGS